jgi:predicted transcriptional regulator
MKYRNKIDIFASILALASEKGVRLTKLMYLTYTSYAQIKNLLKLLIDNGMLEYDKDGRIYKRTKKGCQFLEVYRQMQELVKTDPMNA